MAAAKVIILQAWARLVSSIDKSFPSSYLIRIGKWPHRSTYFKYESSDTLRASTNSDPALTSDSPSSMSLAVSISEEFNLSPRGGASRAWKLVE